MVGDDGGDSVRVDHGGPSEDTRERILESATAILVEQGFHRLSMERVADRAGVVRGTVYYQFGSKAGLVEALISAIELSERIHESRRDDHTVAALLERLTDLWERHRAVFQGIFAMAAVDPQTREVVRHHQRGRRQRITELVDELHEAGTVTADPDDAVDLVWLLTSFTTYDFLRQDDTRDPDDARRLLELLATALVHPDRRTS